MDLKPTNILVFAVLLAGAAHVMLFQNGVWSDLMWLTAIVSVGIPLALYKNMKAHEKRKARRAQKYAEI